jgi:glycerol-3-phosphate dehydrogenase (NAD(P)+)
MQQARLNDLYLPGFPLPPHIDATSDLADALNGADIVLSVAPSHLTRSLYQQMLPHLNPRMLFVSATKGLENGSLLRMSEVIEAVASERFTPQVAVISGPTFAREVAAAEPTALVVASKHPGVAAEVQNAFSGPSFRLYASQDPIGVEIGGAIKNVVAIGAGVLLGLGLGDNALAALITRGLAEMTRLATAMGGKPQTLAGLAVTAQWASSWQKDATWKKSSRP